jgi:hypothetical protein
MEKLTTGVQGVFPHFCCSKKRTSKQNNDQKAAGTHGFDQIEIDRHYMGTDVGGQNTHS